MSAPTDTPGSEATGAKLFEIIHALRTQPKLWKSGGAGGQDQYAGMPRAMPLLDLLAKSLTAELTTLRGELSAKENEIQAIKDGAVELEKLNLEPGAMEVRFKQKPEIAQWIGQAFASMVAKSPNYTEMKFDPTPVLHEGKYEWITVLIQKGSGKTPHQLRQQSETDLTTTRAALAQARGDSKRLDLLEWIKANLHVTHFAAGEDVLISGGFGKDFRQGKGATVREAIDAALAATNVPGATSGEGKV